MSAIFLLLWEEIPQKIHLERRKSILAHDFRSLSLCSLRTVAFVPLVMSHQGAAGSGQKLPTSPSWEGKAERKD